MRKIILLTFLTLDGVMQGPGGPDEDREGGFAHGGWTVPYFDDFLEEEMTKQMDNPFDLLLGRKTFEIFASYWPNNPKEGKGINNATKYVVSRTMDKHSWDKSIFINDNVAKEIAKLKMQDGPDLQVHGSCTLIQTLLENDLIDELWLKIFPVVLGEGKRLFGHGSIPAAYELTQSKTSPKGVILANYKRAGDVKTGIFTI